jgi:Magnesium chelatase, subunit ChlI
MAAIVGGGSGVIRPGAASLAHLGILFLDESKESTARPRSINFSRSRAPGDSIVTGQSVDVIRVLLEIWLTVTCGGVLLCHRITSRPYAPR